MTPMPSPGVAVTLGVCQFTASGGSGAVACSILMLPGHYYALYASVPSSLITLFDASSDQVADGGSVLYYQHSVTDIEACTIMVQCPSDPLCSGTVTVIDMGPPVSVVTPSAAPSPGGDAVVAICPYSR